MRISIIWSLLIFVLVVNNVLTNSTKSNNLRHWESGAQRYMEQRQWREAFLPHSMHYMKHPKKVRSESEF